MRYRVILQDKEGNCLLEKYGVRDADLSRIGPEHRKELMRWAEHPNAVDFRDAGDFYTAGSFSRVQEYIRQNMKACRLNHCENCLCSPFTPEQMNLEICERYLSIPAEEVYLFRLKEK